MRPKGCETKSLKGGCKIILDKKILGENIITRWAMMLIAIKILK